MLDFSCLALSLAVRTVAGRGRVIEVVSHFPSPSLPQLAGLSLKINMAADRSHESKLKRMGEARRRRVPAVLGGMIPLERGYAASLGYGRAHHQGATSPC